MQPARFAVGLAAAALFLGSDPAAQGAPPFSKAGMAPVRWGPGSSLQVGSVDSGDTAIALTFAYDAAVGAVLETVTHRGTAADGTVTVLPYANRPPAGSPQGLWLARFRPLDSDVAVEIFPSDAASFRLFVNRPSSPSRAVFRWTDIEVTAEADFVSWMELRLEVDGGRAEWHSRLGRVARRGSEQLTLDEVFAPIVFTRQPTLDARLLVPIAGRFTLPDVNLPMAVWTIFNTDLELEHPARGQQLQCSALYAPTDLQLGPFTIPTGRKILYFATEDDRGYYKRFKHAVVPSLAGFYYQWAAIYFPVYGPRPFINFHVSPYPAVMCALQAQTDAFWYDVCAHYREFVDRHMGLKRIADRGYALNPDFPGAAPFMATSSFLFQDHSVVFPEFVDQALLLRDFFRGPEGELLPTFMEWQKWLQGGVSVGEDPMGPGFNPRPFSGVSGAFKEPTQFAREQIDRAHAAGINMSTYTAPLFLDEGDWPSFRPEWFLYDREGSRIGPAGSNLVDYGNRAAANWFADVFYDDIFDATPTLGGTFMDVFSGGGGFLRYPPDQDPGLLFKKRYHGGAAYVEGQVRCMDRTRGRIGRARGPRVHPDIPFIATETVSEFLAGHYDFGQHGLKPVPFQMWHNQLFDFVAAVLIQGIPYVPAPVGASNPSPPLWDAVYHEWSRAEGLTVALTRAGLSVFDGGIQLAGMTRDEWGDYMRMVHALWWFQGMKPTSFQYLFGYEENFFGQPQNLLIDVGGHATPVDPHPVTLGLLAFLERLNVALARHDEAGQFLVSGRMERPLATPAALDPLAVAQSVTPAFAAATKVAPFDPLNPFTAPGVTHFYEDLFSQGRFNGLFGLPPYQMPHVLHSAWRSVGPNPKLGLVFVNWADEDSNWEGVFDPAQYGLGPSFVIKGLAPDGAGVTEFTVGSGSGPTELAWNAATAGIGLRHTSMAMPGPMPGRTIQVFIVEPAP